MWQLDSNIITEMNGLIVAASCSLATMEDDEINEPELDLKKQEDGK